MSTKTIRPTLVNGIDVEALRGAIAAIEADTAAAATHWKIASTWRGGTRTDHSVDGIEIGGTRIERRFDLSVDEPLELCGTNKYANPQEYLLSALNACMMVGYAAGAALMGIELSKLEVEVEGDIDLRGFLGIDATVAAGYEGLRQTVRIDGDGTPEQFEKLHAIVQATSPNYFNVTKAVPTASRLVIG